MITFLEMEINEVPCWTSSHLNPHHPWWNSLSRLPAGKTHTAALLSFLFMRNGNASKKTSEGKYETSFSSFISSQAFYFPSLLIFRHHIMITRWIARQIHLYDSDDACHKLFNMVRVSFSRSWLNESDRDKKKTP